MRAILTRANLRSKRQPVLCNPCIYCHVTHTVNPGTEVIATIPLTSVPSISLVGGGCGGV